MCYTSATTVTGSGPYFLIIWYRIVHSRVQCSPSNPFPLGKTLPQLAQEEYARVHSSEQYDRWMALPAGMYLPHMRHTM
jgi:hypothetical protein